MAKVELKQPIVEEISNSIKNAESVVLVNYSGLTVEQDTILRKELREAGVQYKVYKNTMMRRAFEGTAFESLSDHLHGKLELAEANPLVYVHGGYYGLGEKIGKFGWSVEKKKS